MPRKISTTRTSNSTALKDGVYQLLIVESDEAVSKSGNDMVVLTLQVVKGSRRFGREIKDYMVYPEDDLEEDEQDKYSWKFDQLHNALNLEEGQTIDYRFYKGKKIYASLITDIYGDNINNKVNKYLSEDVALTLIEEQEESDSGSDGLGVEGDTPAYEENRKPESTTAKRGRPSRQAATVAEMEPDDDDLMPL